MGTGDRIIAAGRDCDIYDRGPHLVLRRSRSGRSQILEAKVMDYLRAQGYPVPAVEGVSPDGTEMLMERAYGPTMLEVIARRPTSMPSQGRVLAHLHRRLHDLAPPNFLPRAPVGPGDQFLHLDLHPLNVILGPNGPVVIDWANASVGPAAADMAVAWLLMATAGLPHRGLRMKAAAMGRSYMVRFFLDHFDRAEVVRQLRPVVAWKAATPHMSSQEIGSMWRLVEREERRHWGLDEL